MDPLRRADSVDTVIKPAPLSDHDAYDLFGTGTTHVGASVGEPLKPHKEIDPASLPAAHAPLEVESPTAFTLFPSAAPVPPEVVKPSNGSNGAETVEDDFVLFPSASAIPPYSSSKSLPADSSTVPSYSFSKSMPPESSTVSDEAIAQVLYAESEALPPPASYAGDEAYAQALDLRLNGMSLAPPPPQFKNSGNAVDIIAARSTGNQIFSTSWHVMFSWSRFRSNISTGVGDTVRVLVNGKELPTKMILQERGRCIFTTGGLTPPTTDLLQVELFEDRPNLVRFEHFQKSSDSIRYVESRLHLWGPNESVIVADLDGTLTISDVEGHIRTLRLGQYDFLHSGACEFFTKLHELDMRIVYLTARPIDWASASRTHLENAKQQTHTLPPGPLITNSNGLTGALLTEVVNKNPHVFKAQVLNEIQLTLIHAGRVIEHPVFVAGFGNRPTDTVAYEQVGIDPNLIFLIDPYSNLKASTNPRIYESYCDPNALLWLLPKLKHKVPIEKVQRIDDYTVRELVLAEDREQLLMAEREARRLQEEEYDRAARRSSGNMPAMNPATSLRGSKYGGSFGI